MPLRGNTLSFRMFTVAACAAGVMAGALGVGSAAAIPLEPYVAGPDPVASQPAVGGPVASGSSGTGSFCPTPLPYPGFCS